MVGSLKMSFLEALLHQPFLQYALLGTILASLASGVIGPFVVARRISYLAGGISHAVLGGMGVAYYFQWSPILGAFVAALIAAFVLGYVSWKAPEREDITISALWSGGMAIGLLFIFQSPGYNTELMTYLFGNVLLISEGNLIFLSILALILISCQFC